MLCTKDRGGIKVENNEIKNEKTMYNDMDEALLRAKKILPDIELPTQKDTVEIAMYKIICIINALCNAHEKPLIYRT